MKLNGNTLKTVLAFVVILGVIYWAVDNVRSRSYSGANLSFSAMGGLVTITNPSSDPVAALFSGAVSRSFQVSSPGEGLSGSSARQGEGSTLAQQFAFELPAGTSEFTISSGTNVKFVTDSTVELKATVNPMQSDASRPILIIAAVVILVVLFYISRLTGHQWIKSQLRKVMPSRQDTTQQDTKPTPTVPEGGQGRAARAYGDNRSNIE